MEIELGGGCRVRIDRDVDGVALRRVLEFLNDGDRRLGGEIWIKALVVKRNHQGGAASKL
ncbi:hypothetical protein XI07_04805 [Bradyrhizobium sp. CCBAU 11445]|uniref:hypothetical protein n=1 Tax=Bradyrhizobium sp. CCBAU 11445 TaxID=1630896 RepID=UPI002304EEB2|nr:hypothetical protein [Bradyrhizobium sp. CCBAU 11445]MDA9481347.1 hypothetical protein [Bradyrhizobium sp. CCBAU 11445]